MKTKSKALLLALCAIMLVVASVFGTLAYLTDTETVTNTFTVGKVNILLNEEDTDSNQNATGYYIGSTATSEKRDVGNMYHLLPGQKYTKDPMVTILKDSEDSYVRMIVTVKNYSKLKAAITSEDYPTYYADNKFLLQYLVSGWDGTVWVSTENIKVDTDKDIATYEFRYKDIVTKNNTNNTAVYDSNKELIGYALPALFETIIVPDKLDNTKIENLSAVEINVEAHAIQSAGFYSADDAWVAFDAQHSTTNN